MNKSKINVPSAGTEVDSSKKADNEHVSQPNANTNVIGSFTRKKVYSDGKDYSNLKANSDQFPEHEECVYCGSTNVTITDDADICHECGEVYT